MRLILAMIGSCMATGSVVLSSTFAQALPESPAGWAGWVGFLTSGGVLVWFLWIRIPATDSLVLALMNAKDKQLTEKDTQISLILKDKDKQIVDKDSQITAILEHKWMAIQAMSTDRKEENKKLAETFHAVIHELSDNCDREVGRWARLMEDKLDRIVKPEQQILIPGKKGGEVS